MLILVAATVLSLAVGDFADGSIILVIIAASGVLGFWQEHTAGQAVDELAQVLNSWNDPANGTYRPSAPS